MSYRAIRNAYESEYGAGSWDKIKVSEETKESKAKAEKLPFGSKQKLSPQEHERYTQAKKRLAGKLGMPTSGWGLYGKTIVAALKKKKTKKDVEKSLEALDDFVKGGPYYGPRGGKWKDPQHKIPWDDKEAKKKTGKKQKVAEGQLGFDFSAPAPKKAEPKPEPEKPKQAEPQTKHEKAKARKQERIRNAIATDEGLKDVFSKMELKHGGSFFYPYDLPNKIGIAPEDVDKFVGKLIDKGWVDVKTSIQGPKGKEPTKLYQFTSKGRQVSEDHIMGKRGEKEAPKEPVKEAPKEETKKPIEGQVSHSTLFNTLADNMKGLSFYEHEVPGLLGVDGVDVPALLQAFEQKGWIKARIMGSGSKNYQLTDAGEKKLKDETTPKSEKKKEKAIKESYKKKRTGLQNFAMDILLSKDKATVNALTNAARKTEVEVKEAMGDLVKQGLAKEIQISTGGKYKDPGYELTDKGKAQLKAEREKSYSKMKAGQKAMAEKKKATAKPVSPMPEKKAKEVVPEKKKQVLEKPQYDVDFSTGFAAGKAAYEKNPYTDASHAKDAYEKVSSKHGSYYEDGYLAAIDSKRGVYGGKNMTIARQLGLAAKPTEDWTPEDDKPIAKKSMGENDMSGIEALNDFAKGGPYIGPKGGKWADPQHKIPWTDKKGKKKDKGDPTGSKAVSESVMGMIAGKDSVKVKRENQEYKRKIEPVMQAMSSSAQKAIKHMASWGGVAWMQLNSEMQGKLKKLGVVRELENGNYALNDKGKAMAAKIKKSEDGIEEIMEFVKADSLPSGEPTMGSGEKEGGKLDGKGKTSGSGDSSSGPPIGAPGTKKDKFSEDDEDETKAMKEHKKPLETAKSFRDTTPQGQRDAYALERAQWVSRIQKGEPDERVSVSGVPRPQPQAEPMTKSREWNQGMESRVVYSSGMDDYIAEMAKSESFYHGGAPSVSPEIGIMHTTRCPECGDRMSKALTACPHCGHGTTEMGVVYVDGE